MFASRTSSFRRPIRYWRGEHALADIDEFCGRIKAGKDSQTDDDFVIVARIEALIAGLELPEALKRADAYHAAGADAVLIHSRKTSADEIMAFMKAWDERCPVVIVPTTYYATPTAQFERAGVSAVIWANHLLRASLFSMRDVAERVQRDRSVVGVEDTIASVRDVFALQGHDELVAASKHYLPATDRGVRAIVLAAGGADPTMGGGDNKPKCMVDVRGQPLLRRLVSVLRTAGITEVTVVRGYQGDVIDLDDVALVDNLDYATTEEVWSLARAADRLTGDCVVVYGDVLFRSFIVHELLRTSTDVTVALDAGWSPQNGRSADVVRCDGRQDWDYLQDEGEPTLLEIGDASIQRPDGEWIGLMRLTERGG